MIERLSKLEIESLVGVENLLYPAIPEVVRERLGESIRIFKKTAIPRNFADWFTASDVLSEHLSSNGKLYKVGKTYYSVKGAVVFGFSEFGKFFFELNMGHILYCDDSSEIQVINTSLENFVQFVAYFVKAENQDFSCTPSLREFFEGIDAVILDNSESIWPVTLESAEAWLF